jgi:hypothetical protein
MSTASVTTGVHASVDAITQIAVVQDRVPRMADGVADGVAVEVMECGIMGRGGRIRRE